MMRSNRTPVLSLAWLFSALLPVLAQEGGEDSPAKKQDGVAIVAYSSLQTSLSAPQFVVDDAGASTAWRIDSALPQWIAVDFGKPVEMNRLRWRKEPVPGGPRDYQVQLTNNDAKHDGKAMWRTVAKVEGNSDRCGGMVSFPATRAQYVRLLVREQNPSLDKNTPTRFAIGDIAVGFVDPNMLPEGLKAKGSESAIRLSWRPPATAAKISGYNVYRSGNPDDGYRLLNLNGPCKKEEYLDDAVVPGVTYRYRVSALTAEGGWEGEPSAPEEIVAPRAEGAPPAKEKERTGVSTWAVGRFGVTDYLGPYSATEGLMAFSMVIEWNNQFYLMWPTLQKGERELRGLATAGFPYSPKPISFGTVRPTNVGPRDVAQTRILSTSWVGMQLEMKYKESRMVVYETLLSPAIAIKVEGPGVKLFDEMSAFGPEGPRCMAYLYGDKAVAGRLSSSRMITPKMGIPWLLIWFGGGKGWGDFDVAWLVTFQNRPELIRWNGQSVDVSFQGQCGFITMMPLYGIEKLFDTAEWQDQLPPAVARQCNSLVPYLDSMPIECQESFVLDPETNRVKIKQKYSFLKIEDAWETAPVRFSPLPPVAATAMRAGYPVKTGYETRSMQYATTFGPLYAAVDTDTIEWEIPAPIDLVCNAHKPSQDDLRDAEMAKRIRGLFPEERLCYPEGYDAIPKAADLRKAGQGRGEAALKPFQGNYRMWGAMGDPTRLKMTSGVSMLLKETGMFDLGALRLVTDSFSGRKGYVDCWETDALDRSPRHVRNAAEILKGVWAYGFYMDKFAEVRSHWDSILPHFHLMRAASDWAMLSPLSTPDTGLPRQGTAVHMDLDETLTIYEGLRAAARMAKEVGDAETYEEAVYMAAKVQVLIHFYYNYQSYAATYTPWQAADGSNPDPARATVPSLSGTTGAASWVAGPGEGYALSPDVACFYNTYLRSEVASRVYGSAFLPEGAKPSDPVQQMQGPFALGAENLLIRSLLFEADPQKLWGWTRNLCYDGRANDLAVYGSMAVRSVPFDARPPEAAWVKADAEAGLLANVTEIPFEKAVEDAKRAATGSEVWRIGEADGKGEEFNKEVPVPPSDKKHANVFRVGDDKADSWPEKQPARTPVDKGPSSGRVVYYTLLFDANKAEEKAKYLLVVGLQRLPPRFPLYYQVEINDLVLGVHCREGAVTGGGPVQLAFEFDGKALMPADNMVVLRIGGGCDSVEYDFLRCVRVAP